MKKVTSVEIMLALQKYIKEWRELEAAYYRIPSWRIFKQLSNIRQREKLTRVYTARMKHWGILE